MNIQTFPGGYYVDALPSGEYVVLFQGRAFQTHVGLVPLPPGDTFGLMFPVCTNASGFRFGGQAHDTSNPASYEWRASAGWESKPPPCVGVWAAIYDRAGTLHTSDGSIGSQGWRYVEDDGTPGGRLVTGDATIYDPVAQIHEYTALPSGLRIGQGQDGGVIVWDGSTRRLLHPGDCFDIRSHQAGDTICVSFYEVTHDGLTAFIYTGTLAEFRALPPVAAAAVPAPIPAPVPVPVPQPVSPPERAPVSFANHLDVVARERAKYGPSLDAATCFAVTNAVAADPAVGGDGWGLTKAPAGGEGFVVAGQNYRLDKLCHPSGFINDILGSTPGPATPQWGPNADPNGNAANWAPPVSQPAPVPQPTPVPRPAPAPQPIPAPVQSADLAVRVGALEVALQHALDAIEQLEATRATLEQLAGYAKHGDAVQVTGSVNTYGLKSNAATWTGKIL